MLLANFPMILMYCWWQTLDVLNLLLVSVSVQYFILSRPLLVTLSILLLSDAMVLSKNLT